MSSRRRLRSMLVREIAAAIDALRRIAIALRAPSRRRGLRRDTEYPIG